MSQAQSSIAAAIPSSARISRMAASTCSRATRSRPPRRVRRQHARPAAPLRPLADQRQRQRRSARRRSCIRTFDIRVLQQDRGVRRPEPRAGDGIVDGDHPRRRNELLFAVVRDLAFTRDRARLRNIRRTGRFLAGITDAVFRMLRNARILQPADPNLVVCWGGHSIGREYLYTKQVGYELGLPQASTSAPAAARAR